MWSQKKCHSLCLCVSILLKLLRHEVIFFKSMKERSYCFINCNPPKWGGYFLASKFKLIICPQLITNWLTTDSFKNPTSLMWLFLALTRRVLIVDPLWFFKETVTMLVDNFIGAQIDSHKVGWPFCCCSNRISHNWLTLLLSYKQSQGWLTLLLSLKQTVIWLVDPFVVAQTDSHMVS